MGPRHCSCLFSAKLGGNGDRDDEGQARKGGSGKGKFSNSVAEGLRDPLPGAGAPWNVGSTSASFARHLSGSWKRKWKEALMSWQRVFIRRGQIPKA